METENGPVLSCANATKRVVTVEEIKENMTLDLIKSTGKDCANNSFYY